MNAPAHSQSFNFMFNLFEVQGGITKKSLNQNQIQIQIWPVFSDYDYNYDIRSINFPDYDYNYEKIDYNRNRLIMIIIDPNPHALNFLVHCTALELC
jgi:hypothetical protein